MPFETKLTNLGFNFSIIFIKLVTNLNFLISNTQVLPNSTLLFKLAFPREFYCHALPLGMLDLLLSSAMETLTEGDMRKCISLSNDRT